VVALLGWWRWRGRAVGVLLGCSMTGAAVATTALVGVQEHRTGPVGRLAAEESSVSAVARVASDPMVREGRFAPYVLARLTVLEVSGLDRSFRGRAPVLLIGGPEWAAVRLGDVVAVRGRLSPPDDGALAAVLHARGDPQVRDRAGGVLSVAEAVRQGIRDAVRDAPDDARALVPALVVGDDQHMSAAVVADFRTTGLTHLAAVSGTNLTLVLGFVLVVARWAGVRARGLVVVGMLGVAGFVVLARAEPSVVRAAAMGAVALVGLGTHGRRQGTRALGAAVLVLLLVDPWWAVSVGFALSVLATAGILFVAPLLRDRMMRWAPRWVAEAVAVPLAAQLACTPVVAALSGEVSLVAVVANIVVAPAVAPATVLGLLGGLMMLLLPAVGPWVGLAAGGCGWWIITVATALADLPGAALSWSAGTGSIAGLTVGCGAVAWAAGRVLGRPVPALLACAVLALVVVVPTPTPGWPPRGWVMVACDVGQGDGLVFRSAEGAAVVVDTGPEPELIDSCLDRLGVDRVPLLVLTHFHADHVDGVPGVLAGRDVEEVLVSELTDPPGGAEAVRGWAAAAGVPVRTPTLGESFRVGALVCHVVGPAGRHLGAGEESAANNASTVLLVDSRGLRVLATGDIEPGAQAGLRRLLPALRADVLKVPHHGSAHQDPGLLAGLGARLAVISVGADNDYGHPAASTLELLAAAGMSVERTDTAGDIAVVVRGGQLRVLARDPSG
jgi:competence protein ComEC